MNLPLAFSLVPERASDIAISVDAIFYALLLVCGLVTGLIALAIFVFCVRYRQGFTRCTQLPSRHLVRP